MWKAMVARTGQLGPDGRATTELKALLAATAGTLLGLVLQVVAVSTNSWLLLELPSGGVARNKSGQASVVVDASIGLWKICRVFRPVLKDGTVSSDERECTLHRDAAAAAAADGDDGDAAAAADDDGGGDGGGSNNNK